MEKKKEKSYLISQLYDYLEEQIQLLKTDRHQLNRKMYEVMQEKNEKEGTIENQQKIYSSFSRVATEETIQEILVIFMRR
mgnify:CR=1 FL=1